MEVVKNTKIYIAGSGGMLGEAVYEHFSDLATVRATDVDLNVDWLHYADVTDFNELKKDIENFSPDVIINLAAMTDMEECERRQTDAWKVNALGAENCVRIASNLGVPYVYISTAGIFGGEKEFFTDYDQPNPLSIYAKSKYHGEKVALAYQRAFAIRAGWMMGGGPEKDKKFINKIFRQIESGKAELFVVDDKLGTPTYTIDFAKGIHKLIESELYGVYNQVCQGSCSRFDVAEAFLELLGVDDRVTLKKVESDFFKEEYFALRPFSEKLVSLKLEHYGLYVMRPWKESLEEYSKRFSI